MAAEIGESVANSLGGLAAVRPEHPGVVECLSTGDSLVELKIVGKEDRYYVPIQITELYRCLTVSQDRPFQEADSLTANGTNLTKHITKPGVGVRMAWMHARWLIDNLPNWPRSKTFYNSATHGTRLRDRMIKLMDEGVRNLACNGLFLGSSIAVETATFKFGMEDVSTRELLKLPPPYWDPAIGQYLPTYFLDHRTESHGRYGPPYFPPFFITAHYHAGQ